MKNDKTRDSSRRQRLLQWSEIYNQILNLDDPASSDFSSEEEAEEFEREGFRLWKQLQKELEPDYDIFYFSEQQEKILNPSQMLVN